MPQLASHPEGEVRHALEVLAAARPEIIEREISSLPSLSGGVFFTALKGTLARQNAVRSLGSALVALPTVVDPATARAAQATENVWRRVESEFGLLSSSEVGALLGAKGANRAYAADLRKRSLLLAAQRKNAFVFPGFQFDRSAGTVRPWVAPLLKVADSSRYSAADVIMWMMAPTTYFDGDRPADHADDAARLLSVAERAWDIQW